MDRPKLKGFKFHCSKCNHSFAFDPYGVSAKCPICAYDVEIELDISTINPQIRSEISCRPSTVFRWHEFFPLSSETRYISLGEGYTPLIDAPSLASAIEIPELLLKCEHLLPTGSLKDRSVAIAMNHARQIGATVAAVSSTGNHAASVAAYAAAANMSSVVLVPRGTSASKIRQSLAYGAQVLEANCDFAKTTALLKEAVKKFNWYPFSSDNPFRNEGKKSLAYEIWTQLDGGSPDIMIHPIGGGIGLWACWKGWQDLVSLKWAKNAPRMIGAQAHNACPIAWAWERNLTDVKPVTTKPTVAESIFLGNTSPGVGYRTLMAIRKSSGACLAIDESDILHAQKLIATSAGLYVEPTAAISVAAAIQLKKRALIPDGAKVICVLTGAGFKQDFSGLKDPLQIEPSLAALEKALKL